MPRFANTVNIPEVGSTPATPASGGLLLYGKTSDSRLYYKNDAGLEYGPLAPLPTNLQTTDTVQTITASKTFAPLTDTVPLITKGVASGTANLAEFQSNGGVALAAVNNAGSFLGRAIALTAAGTSDISVYISGFAGQNNPSAWIKQGAGQTGDFLTFANSGNTPIAGVTAGGSLYATSVFEGSVRVWSNNNPQIGNPAATSEHAKIGKSGSIVDNGGGGLYLSNAMYYDGTVWRRNILNVVPTLISGVGGNFQIYAGTGGAIGSDGTASLQLNVNVTPQGNLDTKTVSANGLVGNGAEVPSRWAGGLYWGPPTTGTYLQGDWITTRTAENWSCVIAGSPGVWVRTSIDNDNSVPLKQWRRALSMVATEPADVLLIGDSIGEGYYASTAAKRWAAIFIQEVQRRYNPVNTIGGEGFVAPYTAGTWTARWTYSGTNSTQYLFGLGRRAQQLTSNNATATVTFTGDRFWFPVIKGPSAGDLTITIDGGAPVTVNGYAAGNVTETMWDSGALTRGSHTVVITAKTDSGSRTLTLIPGIMVFDGDGAAPTANTGKGVRFWDGAHAGYRASDFYGPQQTAQGYWGLSLPVIAPDLVMIETGANEKYGSVGGNQAAADLETLITYTRSLYATASIAILSYPAASDWTEADWDAYTKPQKTIAQKLGCAWIDWRSNMAKSTNVNDGYWVDSIHPGDGGHDTMANIAIDSLAPDIDNTKLVNTDVLDQAVVTKNFVNVGSSFRDVMQFNGRGAVIARKNGTNGYTQMTDNLTFDGTNFRHVESSPGAIWGAYNGTFLVAAGTTATAGGISNAANKFTVSNSETDVLNLLWAQKGNTTGILGSTSFRFGVRGSATSNNSASYFYDNSTSDDATTFQAIQTGAGTAFGGASGTFVVYVAPSVTAGANQTYTQRFAVGQTTTTIGSLLDISALGGFTAATTGTGVGDKIALYSSAGAGYGFGIQSGRLVSYVASGGAFSVRLASGSGNASSGADAITLSATGTVLATSTITGTAIIPSGLTGATSAVRLVGGTASGAPVSGTWTAGDTSIAQNGVVWVYNGSTWVSSAGSGGSTTTVTSQTGTYTIPSTGYVVLANGTFTVTLPAAATGAQVTIKDTGTGTITVSRAGAALIDGQTTFVLNSQYASISLVSDGTNWFVV